MSAGVYLSDDGQRRLWGVVRMLRRVAADTAAVVDRECYYACAAEVEARIFATVPPETPPKPQRRRLAIPWNDQPLGEVPDRVVAESLGVPQPTVCRERRRRGIPPARQHRDAKTERNAEIVRRVKAGETLTAVGQAHGLSRERVRQIAAKSGVAAVDGAACATPGCPHRARREAVCRACRLAAAAAERAARPPREKRCICTCGQCPPGKRRCYYRKRYHERLGVRERHAKAAKLYRERLRAEGGERWRRHIERQKEASRRHKEKRRAERPPAKRRTPTQTYMERYRTDPAFRARELARSREKYRRWREKAGIRPRKSHPGWSKATKQKMKESARRLWDEMTPEERADRLRRMQAGRRRWQESAAAGHEAERAARAQAGGEVPS